MADPIISRPGEGEMHERSDGYRLVRVDLPDIGAVEIGFDETLVVEPHTHDDHVDSFWVVEGEVEFTLGDERLVAGPGTWFVAPAGTVHGFRTLTEVRLLNVHGPNTGFGQRLRGG